MSGRKVVTTGLHYSKAVGGYIALSVVAAPWTRTRDSNRQATATLAPRLRGLPEAAGASWIGPGIALILHQPTPVLMPASGFANTEGAGRGIRHIHNDQSDIYGWHS